MSTTEPVKSNGHAAKAPTRMTCPKCERTLLLTTQNFFLNRSTKSGFNTYCKPCSAKLARQYKRKAGGVKPEVRPKLQPSLSAIIYLRHAQAEILKSMADGKAKRIDSAHLYTLLALKALEGGS